MLLLKGLRLFYMNHSGYWMSNYRRTRHALILLHHISGFFLRCFLWVQSGMLLFRCWSSPFQSRSFLAWCLFVQKKKLMNITILPVSPSTLLNQLPIFMKFSMNVVLLTGNQIYHFLLLSTINNMSETWLGLRGSVWRDRHGATTLQKYIMQILLSYPLL